MSLSANENSTSSQNAKGMGYKLPPQNIQEIFDKVRPPYYSFVPYSEIGFEINYQRYQTLEQMSDPVVKLAG